jgi:hypothetical protein
LGCTRGASEHMRESAGARAGRAAGPSRGRRGVARVEVLFSFYKIMK